MKSKKLLSSYLKTYIIITIIMIIVFVIIINDFSMKFFTDLAVTDNQNILDLVENNLINVLKNTENEMSEVTDVMEDDFIPDENKNHYLDHVVKNSKVIKNIIVLDIDARLMYSNNPEVLTNKFDNSGQEYFNWHFQNEGIYWSSPYISLISGNLTITISIKGDKYIYVGNIDISSFQEDYVNMGLNNNNYLFSILDKNGKYISNKSSNYVYERRIDYNFAKIKELVESGHKTADIVYDGNKYLASAKQLNENGWYITILNSYDHVISTMWELRLFFAVIIMMGIGVMLVSNYKTNNNIKMEFNKFSEYVSLKLLDYNDKSNYLSKYIEINSLSEKFDNLTKIILKRDNTLKDAAYKDNLTGLFSRSFIMELLQKMINNHKEGIIRVLYIDLDNFKYINDTMGHMVGDEVLISYADRLKKGLPKEFIISRIGGDEFLVIYINKFKNYKINSVLDKLNEINKQPIIKNLQDIYLTNSIGISTYPVDAKDSNDLLKCADTAMYEAKYSGKNQVKFYSYVMSEKIQRKSEIRQALNKSLENEEFHLVYQPIIDIKNNQIRGFEALLRWESINLGVVTPAEFIPIAEETGIIQIISEWVIDKAIEDIDNINKKYNKQYIISVNISPIQLKKRFFEFLNRKFDNSEFDPLLLEVEITESVDILMLQDSLSILNKIKDLGIKISMDDFGKGYSSLSYINKMPISTIKIDKYFIQSSEISEFSRRLINMIESIAESLNIDIVAEGIETKEQYQYMINTKCNYLQGYYLSHPLNIDAADRFVFKFEKGEFNEK